MYRISNMFGLLVGFLLALLSTWYTCDGHSFNSYPYLYLAENDHNDSFPVREHVVQAERDRLHDMPDFLYNPQAGTYRVVEFYVHWCDICRHFSKHYVKYAKRMQHMVADRTPIIRITYHGISCVPNKALCQRQAITGYPVIKLLKPGKLDGESMRHMDAKPRVMLERLGINVTGIEIDKVDFEESDEGSEGNGVEPWWGIWYNYMQGIDPGATQGDTNLVRRTREDLKNDIHMSFDFAMRNNVYLVGGTDSLTKEAKDTLNDFFIVLHKTLPPSWKELHALLDELILNIRYVTKKEPYLLKFLDKYPPKAMEDGGEPEWSKSCSRGERGQGFTCGLWEMFHTITVGLVRYNKNQLVDQELTTTDFVANTIRNFVQHFFACEECREHFLKTYDTCAFNRCDRLKKKTKLSGDHVSDLEWQQLPLWLYEVHNAVNIRLMLERAAREKQKTSKQDEEDAQWPSIRDCHPCWVQSETGTRKWNETVVFSYLQLEYGQRDSSVSEFQRQLLEANLAAVDSDVEKLQSSGLNVTGSAMLHPLVFLVCFFGYVCFGAGSGGFVRRVVTRKKVRTV